MSDKLMVDTFYSLDPLCSTKIHSITNLKSAKAIGKIGEHLIAIKKDNSWDVLKVQPIGESYTAELIFNSIQGKPLIYNEKYNFMIVSTNDSKLVCLKVNSQGQIASQTFNNQFKAKHAINLFPHIDATLILGSSPNDTLVFMNSTQEPVGHSASLRGIIQNYTSIKCVSAINSNDNLYFAIGCYAEQIDTYHIVIVTLKESPQQGGKKQFTCIDVINLKKGQSLSQAQLINGAEELLICVNGSKLIKMTVRHESEQIFRRSEIRIYHSFNFFKPKILMQIERSGDILVQDSTDSVYIFTQNQEKAKAIEVVNKFFLTTGESQFQKIVVGENQIFGIAQNSTDKSQIEVHGLFKQPVNEVIQKLLSKPGSTLAALQLMRSTGMGKEQYLMYQLQRSIFSDLGIVKEYLKNTKDSSEQILHLIITHKIESVEVFYEFLQYAIKNAAQHNKALLQKLHMAAKRVELYRDLSQQNGVQSVNLTDFCLSLPISNLITTVVLQLASSVHLIQSAIDSIFKILTVEVSLNYSECIKALPFEYLDPHFLLKYLAPGLEYKSIIKKSNFWQIYSYLNPNSMDAASLYQYVATKYIERLSLPGKALIILQEAEQRRGIHGLTQLALRADKDIFKNIHGIEVFSIFSLIQKRQETVMEDVVAIQKYFEQAKWIFVMDHQLYKDYLSEVQHCLNKINKTVDTKLSLKYLLQIVEHHSSNGLLFIRDQDLAQLVLTFLYNNEIPLTIPNAQLISSLYGKLQELTLSNNQNQFIRKFLGVHVQLMENIFSYYSVEVNLQELLQIQTSDHIQVAEKLSTLISQIIDQQIKKAKSVGEQVLALSQQARDIQGFNQSKWIKLLQDVIVVKDLLSPKSEVDIYSIFIRKLLDGRVTSSIDQLIKSDIIPTDELQTSVLRYLQEQYNSCESGQFYSFAQNSRQFLELLLKNDPQKKHAKKIEQELKLLECSFYMKQNQILIDTLPNIQIRSDFAQNRLVDRVLQVHGFNTYPESFQVLLELQEIIEPGKINDVITKVLKHLNSIKLFETKEQMPDYTERMLNQLIIKRPQNADFTWIVNSGVAEILFKIALVCEENRTFSQDLLIFLLNKSDKRKDLYYQVCQALLKKQKQEQPVQHLNELKQALNHGLVNKANFILTKQYDRIPIEEEEDQKMRLFIAILKSSESFTHFEIKQLSQVLNIDLNKKLKTLENVHDYAQLVELLSDNNAYEAYQIKPDKKKVEKSQNQENVQKSDDTFDQLIKAESAEDVRMILDMDFTDWNGGLKLDKICKEMETHQIRQLPQLQLETIFELLSDEIQSQRCQKDLIQSIIEQGCEINLIAIFDHLNKPDEELTSILQSPLFNSFESVVTEMNLLKLTMQIESLHPHYPQLLALALYINKLELYAKHSETLQALTSIEIERTFFNFIDKDSLEEMILLGEIEEDIIRPLIEQANQKLQQARVTQRFISAVVIS